MGAASTRNRLFAVALLSASCIPPGACSSSQLGPFGALDTQAPGGLLVTVANQHPSDMRVYLVRGSSEMPLGSLGTLERRTFVLPTAVVGHAGTIRLMADPLGARQVIVSPLIAAGPGDHVEWRIATHPQNSTFSVRSVHPRY